MVEDQDSRLFEQAVAELDGASQASLRKAKAGGGPKSRDLGKPKRRFDKRLRQDGFQPDAVLDLHGLSRRVACDRLTEFVAACEAEGRETALIVHGKGAGVLGPMVAECLDLDTRVIEHQVAPGRLGGEGARVARLRVARLRVDRPPRKARPGG